MTTTRGATLTHPHLWPVPLAYAEARVGRDVRVVLRHEAGDVRGLLEAAGPQRGEVVLLVTPRGRTRPVRILIGDVQALYVRG